MALFPASSSEKGTVNWVQIGTTGIFYARKNGVVDVLFGGVSGLTAGAWNNKGTLPIGYRPSYSTYVICGDGGSNVALVLVDTSGDIKIKPFVGTYAYGSVTYLVND